MKLKAAYSAIILVGLTACNPMANLDEAEQRVQKLQGAYNDGDSDALYRMTGREFKESTSLEELKSLMGVFELRLGRIETSSRQNFNINTNNGITTTVVAMETSFEEGDGIETYTFTGHGEEMELLGWRIDSPKLAVTADDLVKLNEMEADKAESEAAE